MHATRYAQVAAFAPLDTTLSYRVPLELAERVRVGCRVLVPLGRKRVMGVVTEVGGAAPGVEAARIKPIHELLDDEPVLEPELVELLLWMAGYYFAAPGEAVRAALPAALHTRERRVVRLTEEGRRVLAAQEALLRSSGDDLAPPELALLRRLEQARAPIPLKAIRGGGTSERQVGELSRRGLVQITVQTGRRGRVRTELEVELLQAPPAEALQRAPRQRALLRLLQEHGGRVALGELREQLPEARAVARRLALRGVLRITETEISSDPFAAEPVEVERPLTLTDEQEQVLVGLRAAAEAGTYSGFLLHGITGSGKTEVYLRLIATALARGRDAIVLVPEISLTPQLAARFRARFGKQVAVLHSGLTDAERYSQWRLIRAAKVRIAVGARSAIFAPLRHLGVVIVDEEHDSSFKQEEGVRYHARDVALLRASRTGAVAVLGSATPSLESANGVEQGRLTLLRMHRRATPKPLPVVEIVDLRMHRPGPDGVLSAPLGQAIAEVLERHEQAILFLNRRGYSTFVLCKSCGHTFRCENCSVSLTYHRSRQRLACHYCGFGRPLPETCPECGEAAIERMGLGTEQVEQHLAERFPTARIARLDRDTASGRGLREILGQVARHEVDLLVGTQMVTKGHDFPEVTLVGVIAADLGLSFPDFRAAERTFQLLTQVAGRAGRGARAGRVIVQTYKPDHPSIQYARTHDYDGFYAQEIEERRELWYPPAGYLAAFRIDGADAVAVAMAANRLAAAGRRLIAAVQQDAQPGQEAAEIFLLGPAEAPIQRLKGRTRWLLLLKSSSRPQLRRVLTGLVRQRAATGQVRVSVDVDPLMML